MNAGDFWANLETPAFVLDLRVLRQNALAFARIHEETGIRIFYTLKPLIQRDALCLLREHLNGFTASSLYTAILARTILGHRQAGAKELCVVSPGYRASEMSALGDLCDWVVLNSLGQVARFGAALQRKTRVALRINPGLSFLDDVRYDPCRPHSQLGVPLADVDKLPSGVEGLHFHTNCQSPTFRPLHETIEHLCAKRPDLIRAVSWLNLGGGYLLDAVQYPTQNTRCRTARLSRALAHDYSSSVRDLTLLRDVNPALEIVMEPGAALVQDAGVLVASVLDVFERGGKRIAVLDTSVNHLPEVFEYQYAPDVEGHQVENPFEVRLVGCTCLAGDVFGDYRFVRPPGIGDTVVFRSVGAYSQVKAHWFNGIPLPTHYIIDENGDRRLRARFTLEDYRAQMGWDENASF